MLAPIGWVAINGDGGIKREGKAENLEEESKRYVRAPLEKASESEGKEVGKDKRDDGSDRALRANEGLDHRQSILPINRQRNKGDGYFDNALTMRAASPTRQIGSKLFDRAEVRPEGRRPLFVHVNSNGHSCFVRHV